MQVDPMHVDPVPGGASSAATPRLPTLSAHAARVLGCLAEKELTVPDTYPMTVNSLVSAANQSTSRWPVMELTTADVLAALDELKIEHRLVRMLPSGAGSRVDKFRHALEDRFGLSRPEKSVLALLLLRGPQTVAELNSRSARMHEFASAQAVEAVLDRLADPTRPPDASEPTDARDSGMLRTASTTGAVTALPAGFVRTWPGPLVTRLPRQPGQHEIRVAHVLSGEPDPTNQDSSASPQRAGSDGSGSAMAELAARVSSLEGRLAQVIDDLTALRRSLGAESD